MSWVAVDPPGKDTEWQKPASCTSSGCVEHRRIGSDHQLRDRFGHIVWYTDDEWQTFLEAVRRYEY